MSREQKFAEQAAKLNDPRRPAATVEQMEEAQLPLATRDSCAHFLIALNKCRFEHYYLPWHCEKESNEYMLCLSNEYVDVGKLDLASLYDARVKRALQEKLAKAEQKK